jgi:glucose-6-phosphate 1-dehydrogenase
VALKAEIGTWRWAGVPFYLRTGKRLPARVSEIVITFRPIPHSVFAASAGAIEPNRLVIRLQPDEGVRLFVMSKDPGPGGMRLRLVPLDMSFAAAFRVRNPDAYERLVLDVVRGNQTLFMRRDEVEAAWNWIDPLLQVWAASSEPPKPYTAGTWGPSAAIALIERDGRTWVETVA